jgi:hypothetical protein
MDAFGDDGPNIEVVDVGELALILRIQMDGTVKLAGRLPASEIVKTLHQVADEFAKRQGVYLS